jgi:hypothetical protein
MPASVKRRLQIQESTLVMKVASIEWYRQNDVFHWVCIWRSVARICMRLVCTPQPCDFPPVSIAHYVFKHCTTVEQCAIINVSEWQGATMYMWSGGLTGADRIPSNVGEREGQQICQQTRLLSSGRQPSGNGRATSDFYLSNARLVDKNYITGAQIYVHLLGLDWQRPWKYCILNISFYYTLYVLYINCI